MPDSPLLLAFAAAVLTLAGFVKGVIGLGLPTISVGLLGAVMPPAQAAALLTIPNLLTNAWQAWRGRDPLGLLRRLAPMLAGIAAGTVLGAPLISAGGRVSTSLLGAALIAYAAWGLAGASLRVPARHEGALGAIVGAVTGVVTGATGVFGLPAVPYLQGLGLDKDELVQALGLSFLTSTAALAAALWATGVFAGGLVLGSALALAPVLLGLAVGQAVRDRLSPAAFKRFFFSGLLLLGLYLVARGAL
jgi:uncharacterized membrane protein YfcA